MASSYWCTLCVVDTHYAAQTTISNAYEVILMEMYVLKHIRAKRDENS